MEKCIPIRDYSKGIHVPLNTFLLANLKVHVYLLTICMHFKEKPFIYIIGSHIRVIIHRGGVLQFVFISNNHVYIGYIMRASPRDRGVTYLCVYMVLKRNPYVQLLLRRYQDD